MYGPSKELLKNIHAETKTRCDQVQPRCQCYKRVECRSAQIRQFDKQNASRIQNKLKEHGFKWKTTLQALEERWRRDVGLYGSWMIEMCSFLEVGDF
ncbi:unnamed protein product [Caenorhabditis nigoni]